MGLASASGGVIIVTGTDDKNYRLSVLTMKQIGELSSIWMGRLREKYKTLLKEMAAGFGQQLLALRDFEMNEPSFTDTCQYAITAAGIDDTLKLSSGLSEVDTLGTPWERKDLAAQVIGLMPIKASQAGSLPDPTSDITSTAGETKTETGS